LNNHYDIYIDYHQRGPNEYRIVGASVWPSSRDTLPKKKSSTNPGGLDQFDPNSGSLNCNAAMPVFLDGMAKEGVNVAFSYTTHWKQSKTPWGTRWDHYLKVIDPRVHWLSLINAIVIVGFLCLLVSL
jgi:transmembrane 9 superfamily member 2/4